MSLIKTAGPERRRSEVAGDDSEVGGVLWTTKCCSGQPRTVEFKRLSLRASTDHRDHKTSNCGGKSSPEEPRPLGPEHGGADTGREEEPGVLANSSGERWRGLALKTRKKVAEL